MLSVIEEKIESVTLEDIGTAEKGVDVWIANKDGTKEGQQCKSRNGSKDAWTIGLAKSHGVFRNWEFQLQLDRSNQVSLVSPISFILLEDLINRAKILITIQKNFYATMSDGKMP